MIQQPDQREIVCGDESRTRGFASMLAGHCRGGEIILLEGPLGAGKTCFAGGFAAGLGIAGPVPSPTFVLLRSYCGSRGLTLHHFDFYRLGGDDDLATLGLEDCLAPDAVVLAEWAGRCPHAFDEFTWRIELVPLDDENQRLLRITAGTRPIPDILQPAH
jgi:tRNA threonylcarbamoyladenosine biosynthesis protein TsaE